MPKKFYPTQSLADVVWFYLAYMESRMSWDPAAQDQAPLVAALRKEVEEAWLGQRAVWLGEIRAQAGVDYENFRLDRSTKRHSRVMLNLPEVDGRTEHPRYARYYTMPLSRLVRLALEPQIKFMRPWIDSLKGEPEPEAQAFAQLLAEHIAAGEAVLLEREKAKGARKDHRVRVITALIERINTTLRSIYGTLTARAAEQKLGEDWPDSFFYSSTRNTEAPDPAEALRNAIYATLSAHQIELSEEQDTKLQETSDVKILDQWLGRAAAVKTAEELLG